MAQEARRAAAARSGADNAARVGSALALWFVLGTGWPAVSAQPPRQEDQPRFFVQADAYRAGEGGATTVRLAIGVDVDEPWALSLAIASAADGQTVESGAPVRLSGGPGAARETRDLTLAPGEYQLAMELLLGPRRARSVGRVEQRLLVPDLSGRILAVSPIVLGKAAAAPRAASGEPFTFGATAVAPAVVNRFGQGDRLDVAFRVHGWRGDSEAKPDLSIEYVFHQKLGKGYGFFNKTRGQELNPKSLSRTFDGRSGAVAAGLSLSLAAFPPGNYRLTVRVKDKRARTEVSQATTFVVGAS